MYFLRPQRYAVMSAMRLGDGLILIVLVCLLAVSGTAIGQELSWQPWASGLEVAVWEPGGQCDDEVAPLILLRIDPEGYRFAMFHYADEHLPAPLTIREWQRRTGATVVFNAGLFRDDYSYMGLLFKDGRSLGTKRHPQWQGVFVAEPNVPGLRRARVIDLALDPFDADNLMYREAAQSLMLLDRKGKPRVRQTGKRAHQTILAEDRAGAILLIKTTEAVALWELAMCLHDGFPTIYQAMAMDGGASSDLVVGPGGNGSVGAVLSPQHPFHTFLDGGGLGHIPLPAVIGVLPRGREGR